MREATRDKLLIVYDEATSLRAVTRELESRGFDCLTANNAPAALSVLKHSSGAISAAVIDRVLGPGMDGIELMTLLKEEQPSLDAIILTAYGGVDSGLEALRRGAYRYFMAPYNFDEIGIAIRYLRERRRNIEELTRKLACSVEQLSWLQSLLDCIPDEVILVDKEYRILLANKAKQDRFGNNIVGKKCHDVFEGRAHPCETCVTYLAFRGNIVGPTWHEYRDPRDGTPRVAEITAGPVLGPDGEIIAVLEIVRDATLRSRLDEITVELERAASLTAIQETVADGLLRIGADRVRLYLYCDREQLLIGVMSRGLVDGDLADLFASGNSFLNVSPAGPQAPRYALDNKEAVLYRYNEGGPEWELKREGPKWVCTTNQIPYARGLKKEDVREWLELPLVVGGKLTGLVSLDRKESGSPFSDLECQLFVAFASIAAQAIENSMRDEEVKALRRMEGQVAPGISLDDLLRKIVEEACSLFPGSSGHVRLMNEGAGTLQMRMGRGEYWCYAKKSRPVGEAVSGWVAETKREVIVDDLSMATDKRVQGLMSLRQEAIEASSGRLREFFEREGSFACVPIIYAGSLLGTLTISSPRKHAFAQRLGFLRDVAKACASAIQTDRLLQGLKSQVQRLGTLYGQAKDMQAEWDIGKNIFYTLTALTMKGGFEFNRALLFLLEGGSLVCKLAIGPRDDDEARRIYQDPMWAGDRTHVGLKALGAKYESDPDHYLGSPIMVVADTLKVGLFQSGQVLCKAVREKCAFVGQNQDVGPDDALGVLGALQFAVAPLLTEGKPIGALYVDNRFTRQDITRTDLEVLELFANQTAAAIDNARRRGADAQRRAYDQMTADISHALGNVLDPIAIRLASMKIRLEIEKSIPRDALLGDIERLLDLYGKAISVLSRIKDCTTEIRLDSHKLELTQVVRSVISEFPAQTTDLLDSGGKQWWIEGDRPRLEDVFRELLHNIVKTGAHLKSIRFLQASSEPESAEIVIEDEGPGVPREYKSRIFEPLFTTRAKEGGRGLGLYQVQRIIHAHGGDIWECGIEGKGAEFHLLLPLERTIEEQPR
jgi:PAS domain S-box-containing protein